MRKNIFAVSLLILVSACSMSNRKATTIYNIEPQQAIEQSSCKSGLSLEIAAPTTGSELEGRRISVVNDSKMSFYTGIRWAAPISEMTQNALVEGFEKSAAFKNISTDIDGVDSQYTLLTDIRDYHVTDSANPTIKLRFISKLVKNSSNNIIATIPVEKEVTPSANKTEAIVEAFNKATGEAVADIVNATNKKVAGCN